MKLWQKVFCISLVCVILVTGGTTLLVLLNNFRASVRQETDRRISEHSFVVSTITNNVLYERLQRNVLMLDRMKVMYNILNLTAEPDRRRQNARAVRKRQHQQRQLRGRFQPAPTTPTRWRPPTAKS
ncbi:MAG: hypothetical protein ACLUFV_03085 [Acutalibacteraceae bacterium]